MRATNIILFTTVLISEFWNAKRYCEMQLGKWWASINFIQLLIGLYNTYTCEYMLSKIKCTLISMKPRHQIWCLCVNTKGAPPTTLSILKYSCRLKIDLAIWVLFKMSRFRSTQHFMNVFSKNQLSEARPYVTFYTRYNSLCFAELATRIG